mmetsp:Transcript_25598/g.60148  ORF Transcript_25598/g.60148 Transcript_25598/m.60148 type:complete len:116 (-) Transcript_25598:182-529(-)
MHCATLMIYDYHLWNHPWMGSSAVQMIEYFSFSADQSDKELLERNAKADIPNICFEWKGHAAKLRDPVSLHQLLKWAILIFGEPHSTNVAPAPRPNLSIVFAQPLLHHFVFYKKD